MNIVFFSSSDFTIPIIQSIYDYKNLSLREVFLLQYQSLIQNKNQYLQILPDWWLQDSFLQEFEEEIVIKGLDHVFDSKISLNLIVTQPDRENHGKILKNPISQWAESNQVKLFQPEKINQQVEIFNSLIEENNIDMAILASYGQILSQKVLNSTRFGFLNWHPSLLPKYRGPTPMQTVLLNGEKETGLTWLEMTKEMDAGDIWLQIKTALTSTVTFPELADQMGLLGSETWSLALSLKVLNA
jgi:methionyl-tRNA formyltransferase